MWRALFSSTDVSKGVVAPNRALDGKMPECETNSLRIRDCATVRTIPVCGNCHLPATKVSADFWIWRFDSDWNMGYVGTNGNTFTFKSTEETFMLAGLLKCYVIFERKKKRNPFYMQEYVCYKLLKLFFYYYQYILLNKVNKINKC